MTIFGQSAGSWSVECLMSSEKTVGYFHRAISQSGCVKCEMVENDELHRASSKLFKKISENFNSQKTKSI